MERRIVTQDFDFEMPAYARTGTKRKSSGGASAAKRARTSNFAGTMARVPRAMSSNTIVIPLRINYNVNMTSDIAQGFGWTTSALWVNQASVSAIPGADHLANVFDLMRIVKVECTFLPGANMLGYNENGLSTGTRNIPYAYNAFDANDGQTPSLTTIQQLSSCKVDMLSKAIKRTCYPKLNDDSVIQTLDKGQLVSAGNNTIPWYGWKFYADMETEPLTYNIGRFEFKVFYECRSSK